MTRPTLTRTVATLGLAAMLFACGEPGMETLPLSFDAVSQQPFPLGGPRPGPTAERGSPFNITSNGGGILLLSDVDGAGTTALANALVAAGNAVTVRPAPEYTWDTTDPALDGFSCVVHLNGATFFAPLSNAAQQALVDFVHAGGGFIGSQWNGYELATGLATTWAPIVLQRWADQAGSENCGGCNVTYSTVPAEAGHPVLAGIPSPFTFFADGHDAGTQVIFGSQPSTVLMTVNSGAAGVLVRDFGAGRVVNFSHAANYFGSSTLMDANIQKLYTNAAAWACGPLKIAIDIKPGSNPNSINLTAKGQIPVAILTTSTAAGESVNFNAADVNPATVTLGNNDGNDTPVAKRNNGTLFASLADVDGDGDLDMILHFNQPAMVANGDLTAATTELVLNGKTSGGQAIQGKDSVRMTPSS